MAKRAFLTNYSSQPSVEPAATTPATGPLMRQSLVVILLVLGALIWAGFGNGRGIGVVRWIVIGATAAIALVPPIGNNIFAVTERIRHPSQRSKVRTAVLIGLAAAVYFIVTAFNQDRDLFPKTHDDSSYAIGVQMLARGRLWMPPLPLPDFFDSFYLLVRPVYCSLYFPGTALLYVPTAWLHLPTWLMPAMASGVCVGLVYTLVTEVVDGASGVLAAALLVSLSWFRMLSVLLISHVPMLMFGLLMIWAWLRWRREFRIRWAVAMGIFTGWAAITRPADAVVFATPVGIALIAVLMRNASSKQWLTTVTACVLGALPFLALQVVFDLGVTGKPFRAPYSAYLETDQPGSGFGFHAYDAAAKPASTLLEKQENYNWVRPFLKSHTPGNVVHLWTHRWLPMILDTASPARGLLLMMPIGLLGLCTGKRWLMWATLPLFIVLYAFNPFFLEHYAVLVAPAVILMILMGGRIGSSAWPRWERPIYAAFAMTILMISFTSLWEVNRLITPPEHRISDETFRSPMLKVANDYLPFHIHTPAVVLFTYHAGGNFFEEPVYNFDVAWPDDAPIVRAHDLGARNREIFEYYARIQPERVFYSFDFDRIKDGKEPQIELGTASSLAAAAARQSNGHQ